MTRKKEKSPRYVWLPEDGGKGAFEEYALAVGKVVHSWNLLQEKLGQLFAVVAGGNRPVILSIWYSTDNDRAQRNMLRAAITGNDIKRWENTPKATDDLKWLLDRSDSLADERNNAVHAPCVLIIGASLDRNEEMGAAYNSGNIRAKRLKGKSLDIEFDYYERMAGALSVFTERVETAIAFPEHYPWPDRPPLPTRRPRNELQDPPIPLP